MLTKPALTALFSRLHGAPFAIVWWDGSQRQFGQGDPSFILHFAQEPDFGSEDPILALGEAYMHGGLDIRGNWDALLDMLYRNRQLLDGPLARMAGVVRTLDRMRLKQKQKANIAHHYDLGNDFYRLWLDDSMSYSCAYFARPDMTLAEAQQAKIDHTLVKLALAPDECLLDIGCGWGGLLIRAARQYGVRGVGITLSEEQAALARERVAAAGLADRIEIRLQDWLDLEPQPEFDKVVSVGMFEHVGHQQSARFFERVSRCLKPEGLMLLHTITGQTEGGTNSWVEKYIFPGGEVPFPPQILAHMQQHDFHLLAQESLRLHYARTLDCWLANYEAVIDQVRARFDETFCRMWYLYLKGCAAAFRAGGIDLHQYLVSLGPARHPPRTLSYWYGAPAERW